MCGIAGIFTNSAGCQIDVLQLQNISAAMQARGPDGQGQWLEHDQSIGLAHRRLAIIDLSAAAVQPMLDATERYVISYNGEIYNYSSLRMQCQQQGYVFKSNSDTEVLLALYQQQGAAMLQQLRGMFAMAIYDRQTKTLFLARDPYGIKPLYYVVDTPVVDELQEVKAEESIPKPNMQIAFASSLNALQQAGLVSASQFDNVALANFFHTGSVAEPRTCYAQAKMLPAGSYLLIERDALDNRQALPTQVYWQLDKTKPVASLDDQTAADRVQAAVKDSVASHMVADVPVGVFLSAGIDSNVIVHLMRQSTEQPIIAITLSFDEYADTADDEALIAAEMAERYAFEHHIYRLSRDEFIQELPRFFAAMEQPTIDGLNVWFVAKAAQKLGLKVVLSGLGGDELFGGYPSFSRIPKLLPWAPLVKHLPLAWLMKKLPQSLHKSSLNNIKLLGLPHYCDSVESLYRLQRAIYLFDELPKLLLGMGFTDAQIKSSLELLQQHIEQQRGVKSAIEQSSLLSQISCLESEQYMRNQLLRDADWAGMAHSLEIRTPLVDHQLADALAKVPDNWRYQPNKEALAQLLPIADRQILAKRPKTGFTLPMRQWLQAELAATDVTNNIESEHWARPYAQQVYQHFMQRFC